MQTRVRSGFFGGPLAVAAAIMVLVSGCTDPIAPASAPQAARLIIENSNPVRIRVAEAFLLKAVGETAGGGTVPVTVRWSTNNSSVISVDSITGWLTALGVGSGVVTARSGALVDSANVLATPATVELLLSDTVSVINNVSVYEARAVFRDINGGALTVPWERQWRITDGVTLAQLEYPDAPANRFVRIRVAGSGIVRVELSANGMVAARNFGLLAPNDTPLFIERFDFLRKRVQNEWLYMPDLHVRGEANDIVVTRIEFPNAPRDVVACGDARPPRSQTTPLFDFQPYSFSWRGPEIPEGTLMRANVHFTFGGGTYMTVASGKVITVPFGTVVDYGTAGFLWSECR